MTNEQIEEKNNEIIKIYKSKINSELFNDIVISITAGNIFAEEDYLKHIKHLSLDDFFKHCDEMINHKSKESFTKEKLEIILEYLVKYYNSFEKKNGFYHTEIRTINIEDEIKVLKLLNSYDNYEHTN